MFTLAALDPLRGVVHVPQRIALQVRPGLQAEVVFPGLPGERFQAEVVRVAGDQRGGHRVAGVGDRHRRVRQDPGLGVAVGGE